MKGNLFRNMKLRNKIMLVVGMAVILSTAAVGVFILYSTIKEAARDIEALEKDRIALLRNEMRDVVNASYSAMENTYKHSSTPDAIKETYGLSLRSLVDIPYTVLETEYNSLSLPDDMRGVIRKSMIEGSQLRAKESVRSLRFGENGYFWINDTTPKMLMHPLLPDLEDKDLSAFSKNGRLVTSEGTSTPLFKEFVRTAQNAPDQGGLVLHRWPDPTRKDHWVRKLSYVRLFEPWKWIIGASVFVDGVEADAQKSVREFIGGIRYGDGNRLFLFNSDGKNILGSSQKIGPKKNILRELIDDVTRDGQAFLSYEKKVPDGSRTIPMLTFAKYFEPWKWIIGTSLDLTDLQAEIASEQEALRSTVRTQILFILISTVVTVLAALFLALLMTRRFIERPLNDTVTVLKQMARGDLTKRIEISGSDEIGKLASRFNQASNTLLEVFQGIIKSSDDINSASKSLNNTSEELDKQADEMGGRFNKAAEAIKNTDINIKSMATAAEEVSTQIFTVASSSGEVSTTMEQSGQVTSDVSNSLNNVALDVEQMASSVTNIATAIEEMYASMNEVSKNSSRGANVAHEASLKASQTSELVNNLGEAAREIDKVIDLINGIASQTNLLALNATIEAAGAGEAGKGFAVVANEVKELARQTARATDEIRDKIKTMQSNTDASIQAIGVIVEVILEINDIMGTIASAVEEQTATTNEIAKNISETAERSNSVSRNVHQAANQATDTSTRMKEAIKLEFQVSRNIDEVSEAAAIIAKDAAEASHATGEVNDNIAHLNDAMNITSSEARDIKGQARNLARLAEDLQKAVTLFKV
jgi:methyl-accepting chemotaxis protein